MPYAHVHSPTRGLITAIPPTVLAKEASPSLTAIRLRDGEVSSDTGFLAYPTASTTKTNKVNGTFMKFYNFITLNGTSYPVAFTTRQIYQYNTSTTTWDCITKGQTIEDCEDAWTANANVTATADSTIKLRGTNSSKLVIAAAFTTGVAAYENFSSVDLSAESGVHFWIYSTVATSSGDLQLLIDDTNNCVSPLETLDIPALTANTWTPVYIAYANAGALTAVLSVGLNVAVDIGAMTVYIDDVRSVDAFTGDEDNRFSVDQLDDTLIATNGIDQPQKYNGSAVSDLSTSLATGSITSAEVVLVLKDHVLLMGNIENAADAPQRVSWSNVGLIEDYVNGTAGYQDLVEDSWWVIGAKKLGDNAAVIYKEGSIVLCEWVGGQTPFRFTQMVNDQGIAGKEAVDDADGVHYVLGLDRAYKYGGGRQIEPIDDAIRNSLFGAIDYTYINRSIVYDDHTTNHELNIWVPTDDTIPDTIFVLNTRLNIWSKSSRTGSGYGTYKSQTTLTIGDLVGTIGDQNFRIGDALSKSNTPTVIIGDDSAAIYQLSNATYDNGGAAITNIFETPDFALPSNTSDLFGHLRVMQLCFEAKGVSVTTSYSIDGGDTWNPTQGSSTNVVSLTSTYTLYQQDFDVVAHKIRFRFLNSTVSSYFVLKYYGFKWIERSTRR